MPPQNSTTAQPDLDTQLLSDCIYELNIARRHLATYPPGHPLIDSALEKVGELLQRLLEFRDNITLGIGKEALLFDGDWLDKSNPVYRDFASALAQRGIAGLRIHRQPERDELLQFNQLLREDRQTIREGGGFANLLLQRQVSRIEVTEVDYSVFQTCDGVGDNTTADSLWLDFLGALLDGERPGLAEQNGQPQLDPKLVAEILNQQYRLDELTASSVNYDQVISSFISKLQQRPEQETAQAHFASLLDQLTPELRRQFLNSAFRNLDPGQPATEQLLGKLSNELILDTLEEFNQQRLAISSTMVNLLGKLSEHRQAGRQSQVSGLDHTADGELKEQLQQIFREEDWGKFTPESYQQALDRIVSFDDALRLPESEIAQLQQQLQADSNERHCCAIMLRLLRPNLERDQADSLQNNLIDLAHYFLEVGDFKGLRLLHAGLSEYLQRHPDSPPEQSERPLETLHSAQFQQEVLDNLSRWGEEQQKEILAYIRISGPAFADSLIKRLAKEEDKRLRRLYLNTLIGMGHAAHQTIYAALGDRRWFLVRNLLSVLRLQADPIDLEPIYRLESHPHLRVNQELLKLLFKYDRQRADSLLYKQLCSSDPQLQAHAIQLAEQSRSPEICQQLVEILEQGKLSDENLPLKLSIVRTLGKAGLEEALPALERQLLSKRLFKSARHEQLKQEIFRQLDNFPYPALKPLLVKLAAAKQGELSRQAADKLRQLLRREV